MNKLKYYKVARVVSAKNGVNRKNESIVNVKIEQKMVVSAMKPGYDILQELKFTPKFSPIKCTEVFLETGAKTLGIDSSKLSTSWQDVDIELPESFFLNFHESTNPEEVGQTDKWDAAPRKDMHKQQIYVDDKPVYYEVVLSTDPDGHIFLT